MQTCDDCVSADEWSQFHYAAVGIACRQEGKTCEKAALFSRQKTRVSFAGGLCGVESNGESAKVERTS